MRSTIRQFTHALFQGSGNNGDALRPPQLERPVYLASAVINLLSLALPLTILQVYDRVLPNAAYETLTALILILTTAVLVDGILKYFRSLVINWGAASFAHNLTSGSLKAMLSARPSNFGKATTSEHLERLNAIAGLGNHYSAQSRTIVVDIMFIPVFSGVIITIGGSIFASVIGLFALFSYLAMRGTQLLNQTVEDRETFDARKQDFIIEVLRAIQTVKAGAMEPQIMRRYESLQSAASVVTQKMIRLTGTAQTYNTVYASLSTIVIVSAGAVLVLNGRLTLGALACCMLLSSQLLQPLMRSLSSWNEIKLAQHRKARVSAIYDDATYHSISTPRFSDRFLPKSIALHQVTIQYGDASPLFEDVNFSVAPGEFVAITGADGCGRSSLLRAIIQDAPITKGEVWVGDEVYQPNAPNTARRHVRYVGLSPVIFRGTILENITLFGETPIKVALSAAKFTGLDDEVVKMPLGYDTLLKSAAGRDIPAPTAQRITLTRALAMRPSVLILDEANTLLDMVGEQQFIDALNRLRGKMTTIIATHRPSLLRIADRTYGIRDGKVSLISNPAHTGKQASR